MKKKYALALAAAAMDPGSRWNSGLVHGHRDGNKCSNDGKCGYYA